MTKEIKKLNFTNVGDGIFQLDVEEVENIIEQIEPQPVKKTQINFWIDTEDHKRLKYLAILNDSSITEIVSDWIKIHLLENKDK